jgi:hypothetical protein
MLRRNWPHAEVSRNFRKKMGALRLLLKKRRGVGIEITLSERL